MPTLSKWSEKLYSSLLARRYFRKWNRFVFRCALKGLGINNGPFSGEFEFLAKFLKQKETPVLFDVGANYGVWSRMASQLNPSCRIFAFEPDPICFKNLKKIPNLTAFNVACGEKEELCNIYYREDDPRSAHTSLDPKVITELHKQKAVAKKVQAITLDKIIENKKIKTIHLLKIDVEGFEYEVLKGCQRALNRGVIEAIQFEFNDMNIWRGRFLKDFRELLPDYAFYRLLPRELLPLHSNDHVFNEIFGYQNILAQRDRV